MLLIIISDLPIIMILMLLIRLMIGIMLLLVLLQKFHKFSCQVKKKYVFDNKISHPSFLTVPETIVVTNPSQDGCYFSECHPETNIFVHQTIILIFTSS